MPPPRSAETSAGRAGTNPAGEGKAGASRDRGCSYRGKEARAGQGRRGKAGAARPAERAPGRRQGAAGKSRGRRRRRRRRRSGAGRARGALRGTKGPEAGEGPGLTSRQHRSCRARGSGAAQPSPRRPPLPAVGRRWLRPAPPPQRAPPPLAELPPRRRATPLPRACRPIRNDHPTGHGSAPIGWRSVPAAPPLARYWFLRLAISPFSVPIGQFPG